MTQKTQVFINDTLLDLSTDSPIALTFQINDLGEAQNQQGNTSNQFGIPNTQNNRKALGFPDDLNYYDPTLEIQKPYTLYKVRVIQNDIEILPNAIAELGEPAWDGQNFQLVILSGNVDFFDQIGGQLYDMGDSTSQWSRYGASLVWKPYDHVWNLKNVAYSQKNTTDSGSNGIGGWIYPVIDYGLFTDDFTQRIDVRYLRPGFFIKTAIDLLLKFTGFKGSGQLLKNPLYPKLIAQFSNGTWEHGSDYQNQPDNRGLKVEDLTQLVLNHPTNTNPGGVFHWNTIVSDPANQFGQANQVFTSKQINSVIVTVTFPHVFIYGYVTPVEKSTKLTATIYYRDPNYPATPDTPLSSYTFGFDNNGEKKPGNPAGSDPNGWTRVPGTSGANIIASIDIFNAVVSFQTDLPANGAIYIAWVWTGRNPSVAKIDGGRTFVIRSQNQSVQFGQTVQCERIFPDVSQKDLLKDMLQRFGIICQTDDYSATINFASLGEIVSNISKAKDWTSKCVNEKSKSVSTRIGSYAQVNYLEYQQDPNQGLSFIPLKYAWSQINIKDKSLSIVPNSAITSIFGPSLNRPYIGDSITYLQMIDPTDTAKAFSISVANRILIDQKLDIGALKKTVTFTDDPSSNPNDPNHNITIQDIISTPYFWKSGVPQNMSLLWNDLRLLNYKDLEKILNNSKKISRMFMLTAKDIAELDLLIPIYLQQDSSYFYINKINGWIENTPCKVDLIKLG